MVRVWNSHGELLRTWQAHDDAVLSLAVHPNGKEMVTGGPNGLIALWDLTTGTKIREMSGHIGQITGLAFSLAVLGSLPAETTAIFESGRQSGELAL